MLEQQERRRIHMQEQQERRRIHMQEQQERRRITSHWFDDSEANPTTGHLMSIS